MPDHPDHEQLAAFQAGDGDRRQRAGVEAHLAGCPSCAEVVASVARARRRLALLEEPELPAGLHDRLAAAVDREASTGLPQRPTPWYRRPVAWGAAAALVLAALVVPLLNQPGGVSTTAAGGGSAEEAAQAPGTADLPVFTVKGEVTAAAVRSTLTADTRAGQALARAAGGAAAADRLTQNPATPSQGAPSDRPLSPNSTTTPGQGSPGGQPTPPNSTTAPGQDPSAVEAARPTADQRDGYRARPTTPPAAPGAVDPRACLPAASAAADPATRPLVPAFYVEGTHQGRPATVLVTTSTPQPGRVDLWIFPRDDCSGPPLATARVR